MKKFFKKLCDALRTVTLIALIAFLGAIGGQGVKWTRRFLLPGIVMIYSFFVIHSFWVITVYILSIWLSLGYGIPCEDDEGSAIGRFFYKLFKNSELWANIFTRGTIGLLISLSMISIPILKETWWSYFCGSQNIIGIWALVSWRNFGEIPVKLVGKEYKLLNVDLVVYGVTAIGLLTIIHGFFG